MHREKLTTRLNRVSGPAARITLILAPLLLAACGSQRDVVAEHTSTVARYCVDCHNNVERAGGLTLQGRDLHAVASDAATWEMVVRKLRAGMMPPADVVTFPSEMRTGLVSYLESELDAAVAAAPNPGHKVAFHRLNRNEYANVIRDLLGVEVDLSELLPADDASYGFDNIAGVLRISPTWLERYLGAAERVVELAIGTATSPYIDEFRVPEDRSQEARLPDMPFGTRGGIRVEYTFPVDGEYEFAALLQRDLNEQMPLYPDAQRLEIAVDGVPVAVFTLDAVPVRERTPMDDVRRPLQTDESIMRRLVMDRAERQILNRADADWRARVPVAAGTRIVTATFLNRTSALRESLRQPFERPYPDGLNLSELRSGAYLRSLEISGPHEVAGPGETASRERIFVCKPNGPDPMSDLNVACATRIMETLARRAYRRDINETDLEPLMAFYRRGAEDGFDDGIRLALTRLLVSPDTLFRIELEPEGVSPNRPYRISDFELASRLSFFLWSSIPDDELLDLASSGRLSDPGELRAQVRRMLEDDRAEAFIRHFGGQWLYLRNLDAIVPVQSNFPDFDDTLRQAMRRETELFFESIVREDRNVLDLLDADYTFLNGRLARHYGIEGISGAHFRRVQLSPDNPRRGLLGHGSILSVTSYPDRTSPVVRGEWILKNLLGAPPPDPPPEVPALVETDGAGTALSMRDRLAVHRASPNCASCHAVMDPLGFSLENFDAIGRWRTVGDADESIDAVGALPDGTEYEGVEGLRAALLSPEWSNLFFKTLTERMMTYALGRGVEPYDMPTVRSIVREAAQSDHRFSAFVTGIVQSPAFQYRMAGKGESG